MYGRHWGEFINSKMVRVINDPRRAYQRPKMAPCIWRQCSPHRGAERPLQSRMFFKLLQLIRFCLWCEWEISLPHAKWGGTVRPHPGTRLQQTIWSRLLGSQEETSCSLKNSQPASVLRSPSLCSISGLPLSTQQALLSWGKPAGSVSVTWRFSPYAGAPN